MARPRPARAAGAGVDPRSFRAGGEDLRGVLGGLAALHRHGRHSLPGVGRGTRQEGALHAALPRARRRASLPREHARVPARLESLEPASRLRLGRVQRFRTLARAPYFSRLSPLRARARAHGGGAYPAPWQRLRAHRSLFVRSDDRAWRGAALIERWVAFWDRREAPYSLAVVRVLVGCTLLGDLLQ